LADLTLWVTLYLAFVIFSLTTGLEFILKTKSRIISRDSLLVFSVLLAVQTFLEIAWMPVVGINITQVLYNVITYIPYYFSVTIVGLTIRYVEQRGKRRILDEARVQ